MAYRITHPSLFIRRGRSRIVSLQPRQSKACYYTTFNNKINIYNNNVNKYTNLIWKNKVNHPMQPIQKRNKIHILPEAKEAEIHDRKLLKLEQEWTTGKLYKFKGKIHIVKCLKDEKCAMDAFLADIENSSIVTTGGTKMSVIGFDTETKPATDELHPPATVQISTKNHAIIYHLTHRNFLFDGKFPPLLKAVLANDKILKIGVQIATDTEELLYAYGVTTCGVFDINMLFPKKQDTKGLRKLASEYLDLDLEKSRSITCSNWGRAELTDLQKLYAAYDASVVLEVFEKMKEVNSETFQVDEDRILHYLFRPDEFIGFETITSTKQTEDDEEQLMSVPINPHVYEKRFKKIEEPVNGKYIMPGGRYNTYKQKTVAKSFIDLYTSYLYRFILEKKNGTHDELGEEEGKEPVLLIPMFFPPSLRLIFHNIATKNDLYSISRGHRGDNKRMLAIWKSEQAYRTVRDTKCIYPSPQELAERNKLNGKVS